MKAEEVAALSWDKMAGLLPAVVQDARNLQVLMVGYMTREALEQTLATGKVTFFSRSKNRLWTKGETSGHFLELAGVSADCDSDALVVRAIAHGPTCHKGTQSCFGTLGVESDAGLGFLDKLWTVIEERHRLMPEGSYTTSLFRKGLDRMAQKVGEEAVETIIAAKNSEKEPFLGEAADLLYHLLILLKGRGVSFYEVIATLASRHR
ncbi:MAG: bifunctional phosphoribosyl-AMP cyclohydrolase/phosphoribosyl-ATP diphosphatase HisIE [Deltaproteobacteria bacterium]|nr:bifunctional phosphoribosyl-AMP cyclohydrolase/phosphoribosyl-ATP diphosphatase HisIE [Deltaproteobacteria bacterium]